MNTDKWFDQNLQLGAIPITELAENINSKSPTIMLPPFQRDAVWNEEKVEMLWDSILREFPVGSLLLVKPDKIKAKNLYVREMQKSSREAANEQEELNKKKDVKYLIIDGQQRSTSIALGLRHYNMNDSGRLWIDLAYKQEEPEKPLYSFHLCTRLKPWGDTPFDSKQVKEALRLLGYDDWPKGDLNLIETWPVKAKLPVPFRTFINLIEKNEEKDFKEYLPKPLLKQKDIEKLIQKSELTVITSAIQKMLEFKIPAFRINKVLDIHDLSESFNRINKEGQILGAGELFYSGLKMIWPMAHNLVWRVYGHEKSGKLLSPVRIVHSSVRLANYKKEKKKTEKEDIERLDIKTFRSLIKKEKGEDQPFIRKLKKYLENVSNKSIAFQTELIIKARETLEYNSQVKNDFGLPLVMLNDLRWRIWHTIIAWIEENDIPPKNQRLDFIRYAFFDMLYLDTEKSMYIKKPFLLAKENKKSGKPGFAFYKAISENDSDKEIWTPHKFKKELNSDDEKPSWDTNIFNGDARLILMWNQRKPLTNWYPNYDPSKFINKESQPFDADHIMASNLMNGNRMIKKLRDRVFNIKLFSAYKKPLLSSFGNFRYWPKDLNRSDQDKSINDKFLTGRRNTKIPKESYLHKYAMQTIGDVQDASFLLNAADWHDVPVDINEWGSRNKIKAFRKAVDNRRYQLYKLFYDSLGYDGWL
ncbi:MAG: DUF262 domain-containing protein [Spirochaetia bacterium]|nr:DUF262 domain-containing protein [Spirochaetia bacterium]